jgi:hypothetical protein
MKTSGLLSPALVIIALLIIVPLFLACSQKPKDINYTQIKNMDISGDTGKVFKTEEEWKKELSPDQYYT